MERRGHATIDHCRRGRGALDWLGNAVRRSAENGIVIQNNGVDSADSAAGADNVRISNISGNGQSLSEGGENNEIGTTQGTQSQGSRRAEQRGRGSGRGICGPG